MIRLTLGERSRLCVHVLDDSCPDVFSNPWPYLPEASTFTSATPSTPPEAPTSRPTSQSEFFVFLTSIPAVWVTS